MASFNQHAMLALISIISWSLFPGRRGWRHKHVGEHGWGRLCPLEGHAKTSYDKRKSLFHHSQWTQAVKSSRPWEGTQRGFLYMNASPALAFYNSMLTILYRHPLAKIAKTTPGSGLIRSVESAHRKLSDKGEKFSPSSAKGKAVCSRQLWHCPSRSNWLLPCS